jgi:hypothetical protein
VQRLCPEKRFERFLDRGVLNLSFRLRLVHRAQLDFRTVGQMQGFHGFTWNDDHELFAPLLDAHSHATYFTSAQVVMIGQFGRLHRRISACPTIVAQFR